MNLRLLLLTSSVTSFKLRLYHRDVYLGLPEKESTRPSMTNYELAQRFETEFFSEQGDESIIRVKNTSNYVLDVAHDRRMTLLYWGKHGGVNQRFRIVHGPLNAIRIMNEMLCIEYISADDELRMRNCSEAENQLFLKVEDEDEDFGLSTQSNVSAKHDLDGGHIARSGIGRCPGNNIPKCGSEPRHIGEMDDIDTHRDWHENSPKHFGEGFERTGLRGDCEDDLGNCPATGRVFHSEPITFENTQKHNMGSGHSNVNWLVHGHGGHGFSFSFGGSHRGNAEADHGSASRCNRQ